MSDDALKNPPSTLVTPSTEAPAAASADAKPTYTHDEVEAIVASLKTPSAPSDPVAKFRAAVGAAKPEPRQAQESSFDRLAKLMELQLQHSISQSMPRPPAPPKPMSVDEKLASTDPNIWLGRDPANSFTAADRAAIVQRHASKLAAEGFRGDIGREASALASREMSSAFTRAVGHVKVTPDALSNLPEILRRGR